MISCRKNFRRLFLLKKDVRNMKNQLYGGKKHKNFII